LQTGYAPLRDGTIRLWEVGAEGFRSTTKRGGLAERSDV
jgi:hypothetical protein